MALSSRHLALARNLPQPLLHFFKKHPPPQLLALASQAPLPQLPQLSAAPNTPIESYSVESQASDPRPATDELSTQPDLPSMLADPIPDDTPASPSLRIIYTSPRHEPLPSPFAIPPPPEPYNRPNPFLPYQHPATRAWHPPAYSLRRQAELVKLAAAHNVLSLLPWTSKLPAEQERKRAEQGLRVKGTGVGQRVKGKLWERTLKGRLETRRKAMEGMGEMVRAWKERGHGRGWKKWPK